MEKLSEQDGAIGKGLVIWSEAEEDGNREAQKWGGGGVARGMHEADRIGKGGGFKGGGEKGVAHPRGAGGGRAVCPRI